MRPSRPARSWVKKPPPRLLTQIARFQAVRQNRIREMVARLNRLKVPLSADAVFALANCQAIVKSIPELSDADVVESTEIPESYNSPVVIVLGSKFTTPSLVSIYGRICEPALNFQSLGTVVNAFK